MQTTGVAMPTHRNCAFSETVQARRPSGAPERAQERQQVVSGHRKLRSRPPADSSAALRGRPALAATISPQEAL